MADYSAPGSIAIHINEQRAELEVLKATLQIFFRQLLETQERGDLVLENVKSEVIATLGAVRESSGDPQSDERMRQLLLMRADSFFEDLRQAAGYPNPAKRDPSN